MYLLALLSQIRISNNLLFNFIMNILISSIENLLKIQLKKELFPNKRGIISFSLSDVPNMLGDMEYQVLECEFCIGNSF